MSDKLRQALAELVRLSDERLWNVPWEPAWDAARAALAEPDGWIPVTERMPDTGVVVIACYTNRAGKARRIRANWVEARTIESDTDSDIGEYDEETDTYFDPEGWYERIDNWGDYSAVAVCEGEVTHWMHLPDLPNDVSTT